MKIKNNIELCDIKLYISVILILHTTMYLFFFSVDLMVLIKFQNVDKSVKTKNIFKCLY